MRIIYSGNLTSQRGFLNYCYTVTLSVIIDLLATVVLSKNSDWSIEMKYFTAILQQVSLNAVYFMYMRYIGTFGADNLFRKKLFYAQNIVLGIFLYFQMIGIFTGTNYSISPDRTHLISSWLTEFFNFWGIIVWVLWTWAEQYFYRKYFTKGQTWSLIVSYAFSFFILMLASTFFPEISVNYVVLAVNLYIYFFLLETPAYSDLEKTLNRLRKAKELADEANEIALAADAAKGEFLANMSHEIRTPLTTILGMDEIIMRKYDQGAIYEYAQDIHSAFILDKAVTNIFCVKCTAGIDIQLTGYVIHQA